MCVTVIAGKIIKLILTKINTLQYTQLASKFTANVRTVVY